MAIATRRAVVGVAACVLTGALLTTASPAHAVGFHSYSYVQEHTRGSIYTGLGVTRPDRSVNFGGSPTGCSTYYSGNPVYQTQWVSVGTGDWLEIGTGHQCNDTLRWWFFGYGSNSDWYPLDEDYVATYATHGFRIVRSDGDFWRYRVDGVVQENLTWARNATDVKTGLESYAPNAIVEAYNAHDLLYTANEGSFVSWAGRDYKSVDQPEMCGTWNSDTSWRAGENVSCF